jgi:hypothetical protein
VPPQVRLRCKIVRAAARALLDEEVARLELLGWRKVGHAAVATPMLNFQPQYWSQEMEFLAPADPPAG